MSRSILQLVLRHAEAAAGPGDEPDADLLRRFAATRDEPAFAELLRRHGPVVWAACRHLLPDHADAEDAFQATFLALVRSAGAVRNGNAVGGWLHGVAVRVAAKARREAARRRQREHRAAGSEADHAVAAGTWDALLAAVQEEVGRLPDALRTAFVLCDLEGVRQPEAAARLGWKPGTLTGRLSRARRLLVERLTARGLAPAVAGGTVGLGVVTPTAGGAVPAKLADAALSLVKGGGAVPPAILNLARGATPMVLNRVKLVAATVLVAGGLAAGLGPALFPMVDAQPTDAAAAPSAPVLAADTTAAPVITPGRGEWEYLLHDRPNSQTTLQKILEARGKEGWEFCGMVDFDRPITEPIIERVRDKPVLVFKRPKGGVLRGPGVGVGNDPRLLPPLPRIDFGPGTNAPRLERFTLKHAKADELAKTLNDLFARVQFRAAPVPGANEIFVTADGTTLDAVRKVIETLDRNEFPKVVVPPEYGPGAGSLRLELVREVFQLQKGKASGMVAGLEKSFPQAVTEADERTNRLTVTTDEATMQAVRNILKRLEGGSVDSWPVVERPSQPMTVKITLKQGRAPAVADVLRKLFPAGQVFVGHEEDDSLILRATSDDVAQMKKVVADLDKPAPRP